MTLNSSNFWHHREETITPSACFPTGGSLKEVKLQPYLFSRWSEWTFLAKRCKEPWQGHTYSFHKAVQQPDVNSLSLQVSLGLFKLHLLAQRNTPSEPRSLTEDSVLACRTRCRTENVIVKNNMREKNGDTQRVTTCFGWATLTSLRPQHTQRHMHRLLRCCVSILNFEGRKACPLLVIITFNLSCCLFQNVNTRLVFRAKSEATGSSRGVTTI